MIAFGSRCFWHFDSMPRSGLVQQWLDAGHGRCWLKWRKVADCLADTIRHFDRRHYDLFCYVIMPNHCHLLIKPLALHSLESILKSRKSMATRLINRIIISSGNLWQQESYDRIVRDREHLRRVLRYIENNPIKAGLNGGEYKLWIREPWKEWFERIEDRKTLYS